MGNPMYGKLKPGGVAVQLSTDEAGLWFDNDDSWEADARKHELMKGGGKKGFGFIFALRWGRWLQPVPKFWKVVLSVCWLLLFVLLGLLLCGRDKK